MRSMSSGPIRSSGPSFAVSFTASALPVSVNSPAASQRRAISAQVIGFPSASIARLPFAFNTTLSVIGSRGEATPSPASTISVRTSR